MNRAIGPTLLVLLLLLNTSCATTRRPAPPPATAQWYLATVYQQIALSRAQMPVLQMAGQAAARRFLDGGIIWAGGSQGDFGSEAVNRAGGLAGVRRLNVEQVFRGDVVLYGARGPLSDEDLDTIARCKQASAYVIAFAAKSGSPRPADGPDILIDSGEFAGLPAERGICPLDTVTNLINLWVWTGEFTAACTRMGRMPVMLQTEGRPEGRERNQRYAGQALHSSVIIPPIQPGVLGHAYLDQLTRIIARVERDDLDEITQAGRWLALTRYEDCGLQVVGHLYPEHFRDPRAPMHFAELAGGDEPSPQTPVLIHISYQRPPQELIDARRRAGMRIFYCSVLRGSGGLSEYAIFANPHWPIEDACVEAPGYDIPILPASGVIQATIYWSVISEASRK